ncbi:MAG TPA: VOC family protein [Azospirillaceae bacterium]|nr:VOC family protein [Azospirillaceae bacterium]
MLDHLSLGVADLDRAARFYDALLAPLGYWRFQQEPGTIGYAGDPVTSSFWLSLPKEGQAVAPMAGFHLAFTAASRAAVHAVHEVAAKLGATELVAPRPLPAVHAHYFHTMLTDPDGHRIEIACHKPG